MRTYLYTGTVAIALTLQACNAPTEGHTLTYEEFKAQAFHDRATDEYIIDGDEVILGEAGLRTAYEDYLQSTSDTAHPGESTTRQGLAIKQTNARDDKWDPDTAEIIRYCVSKSSFGSRYDLVVAAMREAGRNWQRGGKIGFRHEVTEDNNCTNTTSSVNFNVVLRDDLGTTSQGLPIAATAPYPSFPRASRELRIALVAFVGGSLPRLPALLLHELGHVLGFTHEHLRPEANAADCRETDLWRGLTAYDSQSVMHYPTCNGAHEERWVLTPRDIMGARLIYPRPNQDDILWENSKATSPFEAFEAWTIDRTQGVSTVAGVIVPALPRSTFRGVADFNGDGLADILRQNESGWVISLMNDLGQDVALAQDPSDSFAGTGDFDGDGRSDILWRKADGDPRIWFMDGRGIRDTKSATASEHLGPEWSIQGTADFNGSGRSDILWRNQDGTLEIWFMVNESATASPTIPLPSIPPVWSVQGMADFNGDGRSDILWRNTQDGTLQIWLMNGNRLLAATTLEFPVMNLDWNDIHTGDFNRDGMSDILWRHSAGLTEIWFMNGSAIIARKTFLGNDQRNSDWFVRGVGLFNSL